MENQIEEQSFFLDFAVVLWGSTIWPAAWRAYQEAMAGRSIIAWASYKGHIILGGIWGIWKLRKGHIDDS